MLVSDWWWMEILFVTVNSTTLLDRNRLDRKRWLVPFWWVQSRLVFFPMTLPLRWAPANRGRCFPWRLLHSPNEPSKEGTTLPVGAGHWWYWGEWWKTVDVVVVVVVVAVFDVVIVVVVAFDVVVVLLDDKFALRLIYCMFFVDGRCRCDIVWCPPGLRGNSDHHDFYSFSREIP